MTRTTKTTMKAVENTWIMAMMMMMMMRTRTHDGSEEDKDGEDKRQGGDEMM